MFNIGDKFIFEIEDVVENEDGKFSYKIKGFHNLYMSAFRLSNLERYVDRTNHRLVVGDIVTTPKMSGKFIITDDQDTNSTGESMMTIMNIETMKTSNYMWESELVFTGEHAELSDWLRQYR